ncbi:MAG: hypothetical protein ABI839_08530 [Verrucomicrobiota bacterium]
MKGTSVKVREWAAGLAARLRLLQASFADDPPETRERTLREELEEALKTVALGQRKECIEALATEFPLFESSKENGAAEPKTAKSSVPEDPAILVEHLLGLMRAMPPAEKESIVAQFVAAGFLPASNGAKGDACAELLERIQKLAPGRRLDEGRALRLLDVLIEFAASLDQLVWQVWKSIAPKSLIRHETGKHADFRKTLGPYLTGDSEISTEQVKQLVNKTRKLLSGLMAAMGTVGEIHTQKFLERLSPEAIRKSAEAEPGVFESIEKKCWRKYTAVFGEMNEAAMEREILDAIKKYTEKLVLGADAARTLEE